MKKAVCDTLILILLWSCTHVPVSYYYYKERQLIAIHEKVGETIEVEEREAFDLFPEVEDFRSAQIRKIDGKGLEITLVIGEGAFISVNRDSMMVTILYDYIESFEMYEDSMDLFERKWKVLDYDALGMPITSHEIYQYGYGTYSGGCGCGMCLLGGVPSLLLAFVLTGQDIMDDSESAGAFWPIFIVSEALFVSLGIFVGRKIDQSAVVESIKESRKLKEVEKKQEVE